MTERADLLKLDSFLCFAIYSAGHAFNRLYKPLLDAIGLTYTQYIVMVVLWEQDGVTVSEIGDRVLLDSGTLTPLLKRLETAGLVKRVRSRDDERQVCVHLTTRGRALKAKAAKIPEQLGCATELSLTDVRKLTTDIRLLRDKLLAA